jgi:hypothetical protein
VSLQPRIIAFLDEKSDDDGQGQCQQDGDQQCLGPKSPSRNYTQQTTFIVFLRPIATGPRLLVRGIAVGVQGKKKYFSRDQPDAGNNRVQSSQLGLERDVSLFAKRGDAG